MSRMPPTSTTSLQGIATTTTRRESIAASCLLGKGRALLISPRTDVSNDNYSMDPAMKPLFDRRGLDEGERSRVDRVRLPRHQPSVPHGETLRLLRRG